MIVLASGSRSRAQILRDAGVAFEVVAPGVDEGPAKAALLAEGHGPRAVADALAELKVVKVSRARPDAFVIGADQTLDLAGALYDKVETLDEARDRLKLLRGKAHKLHSAVVVARGGAVIWREVPPATLTMRPVSDAFIEAYLDRHGEHLLGSVGCYQLENDGVQFFSRIQGDYFTILGLPLMGLFDLLRRHGELAT